MKERIYKKILVLSIIGLFIGTGLIPSMTASDLIQKDKIVKLSDGSNDFSKDKLLDFLEIWLGQ